MYVRSILQARWAGHTCLPACRDAVNAASQCRLLQELKKLAARVHQSLAKAEECKATYEANEIEKRRHKWEAAQLEQQEVVKQLMYLLKPAEGTHKVQTYTLCNALHMQFLFNRSNVTAWTSRACIICAELQPVCAHT